MVATLWLISLLTTTLITASECIYVSPISKYHFSDKNLLGIRDNFLTEKRTKPSLSIVNPLDILRQRLLLEMARRQMRENTKQVELNRAILKNVGKRGHRFGQVDRSMGTAFDAGTTTQTISMPSANYASFGVHRNMHPHLFAQQKNDDFHTNDDEQQQQQQQQQQQHQHLPQQQQQLSQDERQPNMFFNDDNDDNDDEDGDNVFFQHLKNY